MAGKKKIEDGFSLSFLDVMACGLGAVLMILILVKFQDVSVEPSEEAQKRKEYYDKLVAKNSADAKLLRSYEARRLSSESNDSEKIAQAESKSAALDEQIQKQEGEKAKASEAVMAANNTPQSYLPPEKPATGPKEEIPIAGTGFQDFVLGLKVKGKRVGVLVDVSGSMAADNMPDAIRAKRKTAEERRGLEKWRRAVRTTKWVISQIPKTASFTVVGFNEKAFALGNAEINSAGLSVSKNSVYAALDQLSPEKGSNLEAGVEKIFKIMPDMDHLYVITDGLPTMSDSASSLCNLSSVVSGACRMSLFNDAIKVAARRRAQVDVILLPFNGDVDAPYAYWSWANQSGGMLLSPSGDWL